MTWEAWKLKYERIYQEHKYDDNIYKRFKRIHKYEYYDVFQFF